MFRLLWRRLLPKQPTCPPIVYLSEDADMGGLIDQIEIIRCGCCSPPVVSVARRSRSVPRRMASQLTPAHAAYDTSSPAAFDEFTDFDWWTNPSPAFQREIARLRASLEAGQPGDPWLRSLFDNRPGRPRGEDHP